MNDSPLAQIVVSRTGVREVAVVAGGDGEEEVRIYRAMLPAVELINQAVRSLPGKQSTSREG